MCLGEFIIIKFVWVLFDRGEIGCTSDSCLILIVMDNLCFVIHMF